MIRIVSEMPWECGKEWWPLIEKVTVAIYSFNVAHSESPVEVSQSKQKFGGLRFYHYNASEDFRQLIDEAVAAFWHTCDKCVTTNLEGYRLTLCPDCRKEIKPRVITKRRIDYEQK